MEFLRELLAKFEIEVEGADEIENASGALDSGSEAAEGFGGELLVMAGAIAVATAALGAAAFGVYSFVESTTAAVDETGKLSATLGIQTEVIQKWGFVAGEAGGSMSDVSATMRRLSKNMFEAERTAGPAREAFEKLGISWADGEGNLRSLEDVLLDSAVAIGGTENNAEKLALAQETLGRGALKLIPGFKGTREEMLATLNTAGELNGVISNDFIKGSEEFNDNVAQMGNQIFALRAVIATTLLPIVKFVVQGFRDMTRSIQEWLGETKVIDRVVKFGGIASLGAVVKLMTVGLGRWVVNWRFIGTLISRAWIVLRPFLGAIAKFLIWALILDDIIVFLQGGNSALGAFLDTVLGAGTATEVLEFMRGVWDAMKLGINLAAEAVVMFLEDMGLIEKAGAEAGEGFASGWEPVIKVLRTVLGLIGDAITAFTEMQAIQGIGDVLFDAEDERLNREAMFRAQDAARARGPSARVPGRGGGGNSSSVVDQSQVNVNLSGKQSPETVRTASREAQAISRSRGGRQRSANALVRGT